MQNNRMYLVSFDVYNFSQCLAKVSNEKTFASNEKKALNNILYRWKKKHGYKPNASFKVSNVTIKEI